MPGAKVRFIADSATPTGRLTLIAPELSNVPPARRLLLSRHGRMERLSRHRRAEGFGRFGTKEFARFARIAKGSELEVLNHLIDAHDQGLITKDEFAQYEACVQRALAAVVGLIHHLEKNDR